jgi:hypothetical protein
MKVSLRETLGGGGEGGGGATTKCMCDTVTCHE